MILLVSNSQAMTQAAEALSEALRVTVHTSVDLQAARSSAKQHAFEAVILDESSLDLEGAAFDSLLPETAAIVVANLVIHGPKRVARMVSLALRRLERERAAAINTATTLIRSEVCTDLTGIMLAARQALESSDLSQPTAHKLRLLYEAAERIGNRLSV
jgi:signal transduction histidine kinase